MDQKETHQKLAGIAVAFLRRVDLKGEEAQALTACAQFLEQIATGQLELRQVAPPRLQSIADQLEEEAGLDDDTDTRAG